MATKRPIVLTMTELRTAKRHHQDAMRQYGEAAVCITHAIEHLTKIGGFSMVDSTKLVNDLMEVRSDVTAKWSKAYDLCNELDLNIALKRVELQHGIEVE